jgi:predicted Zn-dependent protease
LDTNDSDLPFGEWLHEEIGKHFYYETDGWAAERVRRVSNRLQQGRPDSEKLIVEIPWMARASAFTAPGDYIYFSRPLLERCDDEAAALVIAHEIAHHDLGHTDSFPRWMSSMTWLSRFVAGELLGLLFQSMERKVYGPEKERDADVLGMKLCLDVGYDGTRCMAVFDHLEQYCLDHRDIDMVFGPHDTEAEAAPNAPWSDQLKGWFWQRSRGYLSLRERRAMLEQFLASQRGG